MDFDGTLTRRDTTRDLILALLLERPWLLASTAPALLAMVFSRSGEDLQSAKNRCLCRLFKGLSERCLSRVVKRYTNRVNPLLRPDLLKILEEAENHIVIVTASPDFMVRSVFAEKSLTVIGSQFHIVGGVFTGELVRPPCYGQDKTYWVKQWCQSQGDVSFLEAWSDSPSDIPMMMLAKKRIWLCSENAISKCHQIGAADFFWT